MRPLRAPFSANCNVKKFCGDLRPRLGYGNGDGGFSPSFITTAACHNQSISYSVLRTEYTCAYKLMAGQWRVNGRRGFGCVAIGVGDSSRGRGSRTEPFIISSSRRQERTAGSTRSRMILRCDDGQVSTGDCGRSRLTGGMSLRGVIRYVPHINVRTLLPVHMCLCTPYILSVYLVRTAYYNFTRLES